MIATVPFHDFIARIRGGDEDAARELVRQFEKVIRREVHLRLDNPRLYRVFDSMDISQSVLVSFFARASSGQFDLETPAQLVKLLIKMTRNKVASKSAASAPRGETAGRPTPGRSTRSTWPAA